MNDNVDAKENANANATITIKENTYETYNIFIFDLQNTLNTQDSRGYEPINFYYYLAKESQWNITPSVYVNIVFKKKDLGYGEESSAEVIGAAFDKAKEIQGLIGKLQMCEHLGCDQMLIIIDKVKALINILAKQ